MQPNNLSHETDRLLSDSKRLLADNQTGGRHRLAGKNSSIGKASAEAKLKQLDEKAKEEGGKELRVDLACFGVY